MTDGGRHGWRNRPVARRDPCLEHGNAQDEGGQGLGDDRDQGLGRRPGVTERRIDGTRRGDASTG